MRLRSTLRKLLYPTLAYSAAYQWGKGIKDRRLHTQTPLIINATIDMLHGVVNAKQERGLP